MKQEGIVGVGPSVEQSTAETLDIDMCLTSGLFEVVQRWRIRVIFRLISWHSKLPLSRFRKKKLDLPVPHFQFTKLGSSAGSADYGPPENLEEKYKI